MEIQIIEIASGFKPVYKHEDDACADCRANVKKDFAVKRGERVKIPLGFAIGLDRKSVV